MRPIFLVTKVRDPPHLGSRPNTVSAPQVRWLKEFSRTTFASCLSVADSMLVPFCIVVMFSVVACAVVLLLFLKKKLIFYLKNHYFSTI